jgi:hypothetical protein
MLIGTAPPGSGGNTSALNSRSDGSQTLADYQAALPNQSAADTSQDYQQDFPCSGGYNSVTQMTPDVAAQMGVGMNGNPLPSGDPGSGSAPGHLADLGFGGGIGANSLITGAHWSGPRFFGLLAAGAERPRNGGRDG